MGSIKSGALPQREIGILKSEGAAATKNGQYKKRRQIHKEKNKKKKSKANQKKKVPKKFFNSKNSLTKMPRLKTKKKENLRKIRLEPVIKKKPSIVNKLESISFANDN